MNADGFRVQAAIALADACELLPVDDVVRWQSQDLYERAWILRQDLIITLRDSYRAEEAATYVKELRAIQAAAPGRNQPDNFVHQLDAYRIDKLDADVRFALDDVDGAVQLLQSAIDPLNGLMAADPDNSEPRYLLSTVEAKLGRILYQVDRPEDALPHLLRDLELTQIELQATDSKDPQTIIDTASVTLRMLAQTHAKLDQHDEAITRFQEARDMLPAAEATLTREQFIALQTVLQAWADYQAGRGDFAAAMAHRKELDRAARPFMERDPRNLKNIENVARNLYMTGLLSLELLDQAMAQAETNSDAESKASIRQTAESTLKLRLETLDLMREIIRRVDTKDFSEPPAESPDVLRSILEGLSTEIEGLKVIIDQLPPADV